ncbi:hypothetical protein HFO97_27905 [Rhizobium leguminosarum]|uniref:hypothetical protein n=1 Tax=Rhizobium leguminosarum TaxID=384 RepID=UPI001C98B5F8|nr:hypothetical protein [Rhizobium leguminosarum]MBY5363697.1 hypothetical protein [Rhizobium leguminosarum]
MSGQGNRTENSQPLSVWGYVILSVFGLCLALFVGWYALSHLADIKSGGIVQQVYYVLLLLLGLGTAAFLFGGMRSTATIKGQHFGWAIDVGGPAAGAALVVLGGFYLAQPEKKFDLAIRLENITDTPAETSVVIDYARHDILPVNSLGDALMKDIGTDWLSKKVKLRLESKNYKLEKEGAEYAVPEDRVLRIPVQKIAAPNPKKQQALDHLATVIEKIKATQISNDEFVLPSLQKYIDEPSTENWMVVTDAVEESLKDIQEGIRLSIEYDSELQQVAAPGIALVSATQSQIVDRRFQRQFSEVRSEWNGRFNEKKVIMTYRDAPPTIEQAKAWQKDLVGYYKNLNNILDSLNEKLVADNAS